MKKILISSIVAISIASGAAYKLPEQSIKGTALSAANVASCDGADCAYYNPANISFLDPNAQFIEGGLTFVHLPSVEFKGKKEILGVARDVVKTAHTALLHGSSLDAFYRDIRTSVLLSKIEAKDPEVLKAYSTFVSSDKKWSSLTKTRSGYVLKEFLRTYGDSLVDPASVNYDKDFASKFSNESLEKGVRDAYGILIDIIKEIQELSVALAPLGQIKYKVDGQWFFSEAYVSKSKFTFRVLKPEFSVSKSNTKVFFDTKTIEGFKDKVQCDTEGKLLMPDDEEYEAKISGLFANITHSKDAFVLRRVIDSLDLIIPKHDDYITRLSDMAKVDDTIRKAIVEADKEELGYTNHYTKAIATIADNLETTKEFVGEGLKDIYEIYVEYCRNTIKNIEALCGKEPIEIKGNNFVAL